MQSLKGHKITLIAVLDLLGWDNVEVRSSLADSLLALGQMNDICAADLVLRGLVVFVIKDLRVA
mgnify:CR=1 FL=1